MNTAMFFLLCSLIHAVTWMTERQRKFWTVVYLVAAVYSWWRSMS